MNKNKFEGMLAKLGGELSVFIDSYKTMEKSGEVHKEWFLITTRYMHLLQETFGVSCAHSKAIRILLENYDISMKSVNILNGIVEAAEKDFAEKNSEE